MALIEMYIKILFTPYNKNQTVESYFSFLLLTEYEMWKKS